MSGGASLRQSYGAFSACPGLVHVSGLDGADYASTERLGISFSQFAASNKSRPADFVAELIPGLIKDLLDQGLAKSTAIPANLHILDSTFLRVSLKLAPWVSRMNSERVSGVRLQLRYMPAFDLPEQMLITTTKTNDCQALDQMILENPGELRSLADQTLVLDLGYYSHKRFASLLAARVHLLTRLHPQATVQVDAELPVQRALTEGMAKRITIISDQQVTLGSPKNRRGAVLPNIRLVTAVVDPLPKASRQGCQAVTYRIVTDRWDLTAAEAIQVYLWRWQIELFFRWLKSHVKIPRLLGYSRNAVELTVWLGLLVHLLIVLAVHHMGRSKRSPALLRHLGHILGHITPDDVPPLQPQLRQLRLPLGSTPFPVPP
jgi:hypothetical protein